LPIFDKHPVFKISAGSISSSALTL